MNLSELNEINFNELGSAPLSIRIVALTALILLVLGIGLQYDLSLIHI